MKYKKIMLILITAIFLASIAGVSAGDAEDAIAISEDAVAMEQSDDEELILEDNDVDKPILGEGASTGSFTDLNDLINNQYDSNDTITLSCNYTFNGTDDDDSGFIHGISINRRVTIDGKGCTIDGSHKARIFNIGNGGSVKFLNINFINGKATGIGWEMHGGAISAEFSNCVVECCNFTSNTADDQGGALMRVTAYNCTFTGNTAKGYGGAIQQGSAYNCTFTGNTAEYYGGAIYYGSAYNCTFTGNTANEGGAMCGDLFQPERFNATLCMFDSNTPDDYRYIRIVNVVLSADDLTTSYNSGDRLLFNLTANNTNYVGFNTTIKIYQEEQAIGTYYALSGEGWVVDLSPGTYKAVLSLDKYAGVTQGVATITVNKAKTKLLANPITATYNTNKKMVITLTDSNGKPLNGVKLTVKIKSDKTYTTDKNGQVKISVGKLTPKTYNVKITFKESADFKASQTTVKVTVKKAKSKITVKKKTVKKAKKYTVTLKSGKKPIKKAKVILKIKKKTFKAKTNKKGKATFKIKKLKKGTYTAKVTFKGNKYYKKSTKKVKIKVK